MVLDCVVVGSGPAGLAAAIYLQRFKLHHLLVGDMPGGQLLDTDLVENYPGFALITGLELTSKLNEHALNLGSTIKESTASSIVRSDSGFEVTMNGEVVCTKTVILATGAKYKMLNIPGESEFLGSGVSFCTTCDAFFYTSQHVAVVGGGNSALSSALILSKIASTVLVVNKNSYFKGDGMLLEKCMSAGNIEFTYNSLTSEIKGMNGSVSGLTFVCNGTKVERYVTGVFIKIGMLPRSELVSHFGVLNKFNEVIVDSRTSTSVPGLFAAGDVTDCPFKQINIATGSGIVAAIAVNEYLQNL